MKVKTYGTRGSLPVSSPDAVRCGGNTTCLRVYSDCLPEGLVLAIDAGSGFRPLSTDAMKEGMKSLTILHTHYHHDHTQGALIAPPFYMNDLPIHIYGPVENNMGPRDVYEAIMRPPLHPLAFNRVAHHLTFHPIEHPTTKVILFHPKGGCKVLDVEHFRRSNLDLKQMPFRNGKYDLKECLQVTMFYADHPERTISYRFDEHTTGRTFVFLTDEECRAALPGDMKIFLDRANLLIQDAQYSQKTYNTRTAGFGHGTPEYVVQVAKECHIGKVGLTHHDPGATDADVEALVADGLLAAASEVEVVACRDYDLFEV